WGWWRLRQLPPVEAIYQRMLVWAGDRGVPKRPYQTPLEHTALLKEQLAGPTASAVEALSAAYMRWRYGAIPTDPQQLRQLLRQIRRSR
ncbi:MAG: DUF4129 domain-containing protein, partial [Cyanobacteria bacterium P01_A01_bin.135]